MSIVYKCKMCGGNLDVTENSRIASCPYCGANQAILNMDDAIIANWNWIVVYIGRMQWNK